MIGLRFSIRRDALVASITQPSIVYPVSTGTTSVPLQSSIRRDPLVGSGARRWIIHCHIADATSASLRHLQGPACQVRCITLEYPFWLGGHNKRAPPSCSVTLTTNSTRARIPIQYPGVLVRTLYRRL